MRGLVVEGLERACREHALAAMPADPTGGLAAMSLRDLLQTYGSWKARLIPALPRTVHISSELAASPEMAQHKTELDAIVAKMEAGALLRPHLSKRVRFAHDPTASARSTHHRYGGDPSPCRAVRSTRQRLYVARPA
jgi:hypothetical protein